jgi:hypothetical protein
MVTLSVDSAGVDSILSTLFVASDVVSGSEDGSEVVSSEDVDDTSERKAAGEVISGESLAVVDVSILISSAVTARARQKRPKKMMPMSEMITMFRIVCMLT